MKSPNQSNCAATDTKVETYPSMDKNVKTAVVTGSSSGIGRAIALALAEQGWNLVIHGRSMSDELTATRQQLLDLGRRVSVVTFDFSTGSLDDFVDQVWEVESRIGAWVNNAGGDVLTGGWRHRPLEAKLDYLLRVDVVATLLLSRLVGNRMIEQTASNCGQFFTEQISVEAAANPAFLTSNKNFDDRSVLSSQSGSCSILNMGWDQAAHGMAGESGELFATTKGAIMAMSKSLAQSLAPVVRVNCIAPGWIKTEWGSQADESWSQRAQRESLMKRWGTPDDVAQVAAFLCSDQAKFISGQIIPVNGGFRFSQL